MKRSPLLAPIVALVMLLISTSASAFCWFNCNYTKTQYPIVLAHGLLGYKELAGVDYFYGIVDSLRDGGATVYVTEVSPMNSSVVRGEQLITQLDEIRAIRGQPSLKFNLVAHSQGGLDARYVAGVRPDLVASLTTVGSPHQGGDPSLSALAALGDTAIIDAMGDLIGLLYDFLGGSAQPIDPAATFALFDPANIAAFSADFPAGMPTTQCGQGAAVTQTTAGPIRNYSWTGNKVFTNALDPGDGLLVLLSSAYSSASDGLVPVCSAHFGTVLRNNYWMNHLDEVNQLLGITSVFESDPKSVFRAHANRLKNAGL
ncbi:MAG: esterase/lipase family protein [Porticoccaceae bacterium]